MTTPGLRDLIQLETVRDVRLSPNGDFGAIRLEYPHWEDNRYCQDVVIISTATGKQKRLTRFADCSQIRWLNEDTLAVLKSDGSAEDKPQVYVYEGLVGDGWQVTRTEKGVSAFESFATGIVYLARKVDAQRDYREEQFGTYQRAEAEAGRTGLYYLDLVRLASYEREMARSDEGGRESLVRPEVELSSLLDEPVAIQRVVPSPTGESVYVNAWPTNDLTRSLEASVHRISFEPSVAVAAFIERTCGGAGNEDADLSYLGSAQRLHLPERASLEAVSPDGARLLVEFPGRDTRVSTPRSLWVGSTTAVLAAASSDVARTVLKELTASVRNVCFSAVWHDLGIDVQHAEGTRGVIRRLDPDGIDVAGNKLTGEVNCERVFHTTQRGQVACVGDSASTFLEAWLLTEEVPQQLTNFSQQVAGWDLGEVRTIRWTSKDGTEIDGVLRLPPGFDESRRYPLAFVVHGGPRWFDSEQLLPKAARRYYPEVQLAAEGVMVLHPNYRGSLGRGPEFQELNVGNLGVGDLWDMDSAIDHLDERGWVDTDRIACMGWSQGGYISAFAGLHSNRFAAVSVGAGISDWYTYAISNDIPDFTRDFLGVELFGQDRSALNTAAPISAIDRACTPMLIQHGGKDRRVPVSNAMELFRGLQEKGVPVELFVYPDFAHPITKPRENHAVMHQNLTWFRHWLLGSELNFDPPTRG